MPRKASPRAQKRRADNEAAARGGREMRAHLGLDLGTQTPQSVHHYCRDHQIQELTALRSDPADGADIGFMNRVLAVCALPRMSQGTARNFVRHSGPYTMNLTAMDARFGLPYGTYPRLVFAWMCTEVVRTRNPVLSLGRSFSGFMKQIGVLSSDSGGRSGVRTRLREQMNRLFCSAILLTYQEAGAEWRKGQLIADESHLWWDPHKPDALTLWESTVEINSKLFLEILAHPVPVDPPRAESDETLSTWSGPLPVAGVQDIPDEKTDPTGVAAVVQPVRRQAG